ncbi:serine/threonine-protein kinase [Streptomyces sp. NPDC029216]|uniref:serine/threonine-protein kinase n=1 Tax=Streptomyces sp. NPDC029216 TaxID=3154701 RepID=UPI0033EA2F12
MAGTDDDAAGRLVAGRYRLVRRLGAGGMGRVWLAQDEELACEVAVKEIAVPQDLPEHELNARIARARGEARHSARLRGNPHVVTVYDCLLDDGLPWIVMEYAPGVRDLEAVVREAGPLPPGDTARLGLALLDALQAGHRLGILHRDVKPSNILLAVPDPDAPDSARLGRVLLSDYGISLQRDVGEPRLTNASGIVGTPGYLAPERARGAEPTPEGDLFSLGATLYYAVEGRGPFDRGSYLATLAALLTDDPAPPVRAGDLAPVLLKLLDKDPAHRLGADDAARLLHPLATETPPTPLHTITDVPQGLPRPPAPTTPAHPPSPPPSPAPTPSPHPPSPAPFASTPPPSPPRRTRRNAVLAGSVLLAAGAGVWALVTALGGSGEPAPGPASTGPVMPYGEAVGLTRALRPGDCVNAVWTKAKFTTSPPGLGLTECSDSPHSGQVLATFASSSFDDARKNGAIRCETLLAGTVNAMADARAYALPPGRQGWEGGVHDTACLIFNKTVDLSSNAGRFRKAGEGSYLDNSTVGDCWNNVNDSAVLVRCETPHDGQVVGYVTPPAGMAYQAAKANAEALCTDKYGSAYANATNGIAGSIAPEAEGWADGFRFIECEVGRSDGKKLTSSIVGPSRAAVR